MDSDERLVHRDQLDVAGNNYEVLVYTRLDGRHIAKTILGPNDVVINDGCTLQEALEKHRRLLPLALDSRTILGDFKQGRSSRVN